MQDRRYEKERQAKDIFPEQRDDNTYTYNRRQSCKKDVPNMRETMINFVSICFARR